ncbi:putative membrane protein [Aquimonas voraii]|uniref:Putative membrane protein n=2 Tax=Aquimonas voraii TaxID=265719 RepID=A0A1G6WSB6_9GAMM|nr:putative membrane protein [Aquimonas voraii]
MLDAESRIPNPESRIPNPMLVQAPRSTPSATEFAILIAVVVAALVWSAIDPTDRLTWLLEVVWVIAALPLLIATRRRFPLTRLLYWLIAIHCLILIYGGAWTYAQTPLGLWVQEALELSRNHYDRLGHFAQGFIPAILGRELLLRKTELREGAWLFYLVTSACLAFSAFFEMLEWWAALVWGGAADAFLATQGDVWDTQWDMFLALCGAIAAQLLLARWHARQLPAA